MTSCRVCDRDFVPMRPLQAVCSVPCARKVPVKVRKAAKATDKARREAVKPRSKWIAEAQAAFNSWIRARDAGLGCISCGRHHGGQWHAGHYVSIGAKPELRFDEKNCHKQCQPCNTHLHGNLVLYRAALIERYGQMEVTRLEGPNPLRKYSVDDLREIKREYKARLAELRAAE